MSIPMLTVFIPFFIGSVVLILFSLLSFKMIWESWSSSTFECGFSSYQLCRNSYSVHFFLVALIFLFLDLELCSLMPYLNEELESNFSLELFMIFVISLLLGLVLEWKNNSLNWVN